MENIKKFATSWSGIILAFIIFWPLGIALLYMRFFVDGGKLKVKANVYKGLAIICYICLFCIFIAMLENGDDMASYITALIIFFVSGVATTIPTCKITKKYKYYKKYSDYISARRNVTVEELAQKMGRNAETVIEDVAKVFEYQMLKGYITEDNEIVIMREEINNNHINYAMQEKKQVLTKKCKNCGASNKFVEGKENRCEYCDSLLINN